MTQDQAITLMKSGKNVFLTGSAGTGKTYVLNQFIEHLEKNDIEHAVTASTGIAATHLGGMTIHSWSGLGISQNITEEELDIIESRSKVFKRINEIEILIIDEISMLHRQTLQDIDTILRHIRRNPQDPFGGVQIIVSGDFFQLPPVTKSYESSQDRYAFMAPVWVEANFTVCYLDKQYRQGEDSLLNLLNNIRSQSLTEEDRSFLESRSTTAETEEKMTQLFTHNLNVDTLNKKELKEIDEKEKRSTAKTKGNKQLVAGLIKNILAPEELVLKIGAQVMFVKNHPEGDYMNGTMGTVVEFKPAGNPVVKLSSGRKIEAEESTWSIDDDNGKTLASFTQIPLRLAWAITVHKSQGMTLEKACMDLSKCFERGQGYVALSRVSSAEGLHLIGYNNCALEVDQLVLAADVRFRELSQEAEKGSGDRLL